MTKSIVSLNVLSLLLSEISGCSLASVSLITSSIRIYISSNWKEDNSKITYFVIEEVEEESIVKLIEKMLVNIILTGCNGGLC